MGWYFPLSLAHSEELCMSIEAKTMFTDVPRKYRVPVVLAGTKVVVAKNLENIVW
jgi:hypothetical protein